MRSWLSLVRMLRWILDINMKIYSGGEENEDEELAESSEDAEVDTGCYYEYLLRWGGE
jgi:hypothetical protein